MNKFKRVAFTKKYSGGGGGSSVNNIPPELMPYLVKANQAADNQYNAGNLSSVAGANQNQLTAFNSGGTAIAATAGQGLDRLNAQQQRLENMSMQPTDAQSDAAKKEIVYNAQKQVAGLNTQFGSNGTLGSARQAVMQGAQNAETTGKLAAVDADYQNKMFQNRLQSEGALGQSINESSGLANSSTSGLANIGAQERAITQSELDNDWQGLQRYASTVYGSPARQTVTQGGGK